jgi:four helix bundle protein
MDLRVWNDAMELYAKTCRVFRGFPFELKKVASQQMASVDSVHRNIAEGYCRRSLSEYINFLNFALGSLGESASGLMACKAADQVSEVDFDELNGLQYRLENGLIRLSDSLKEKQRTAKQSDMSVVREPRAIYGDADVVAMLEALQHPSTPLPQHPEGIAR